jgi:group I intron endonuclease
MTDKNQGEIYLITNIKNGKKYVGQAVCRHPSGRKGGAKNRWTRHLRNSKDGNQNCVALENAIKKYGKNNFKLEVLIQCNKEMLNYYEIKFIKLYNSLYPFGYNLEEGGTGKEKVLNGYTKTKISIANRFSRVSEEDKNKILQSMKELNINEMPIGIHYNHNTKGGSEGFKVGYNYFNRSFIAKGRTLTEKLQQALTYLDLLKREDKEGIEEFDKKLVSDSFILMNKAKNKIKDSTAIEVMKKLNIDILPMYVRYEKRSSRFYVKKPKESNKYFTKDNPEQSLKEAINYINSSNGNRSEGLVNPMMA